VATSVSIPTWPCGGVVENRRALWAITVSDDEMAGERKEGLGRVYAIQQHNKLTCIPLYGLSDQPYVQLRSVWWIKGTKVLKSD